MAKTKSKPRIYQKKSKASDVSNEEVYVHDSDDGRVCTDDDESIADSGSEVGWNSEDETTFNMNKNRIDEDEDDIYDDDEDLQDGEILLSDLLSGNSSTVKSDVLSSTKTLDKSDYFDSSGDDTDGTGNESGEDTDDEDHDDNSEIDDEDDDEANHDGLLKMIEKYSKGTKKKKSMDNGIIVSQNAQESEFSSMIGAKGDNAVSMEDLIGALEGSGSGGDVASMKKTLTGLVQSKGPPKHVDKVVAGRVERNLSYNERSEDMKKWQDTVAENKSARTLDLAQDRRQLPSHRSLIKNFEPANDMEKEVQMILLNGNDESALEQAEEDELGNSNLTAQELKARQNELGKVRALLFYEQMKRHRVNKIKSKAYHRILKRKKKHEEEKSKAALQNAYDSDDDDDDEKMKNMSEEEAVRRIKERMDLRHHNTSKWARMAAKHSNGNKNLREAYHEAVLLGHELSNKVNNSSALSERDDVDDDEGDENWNDESSGSTTRKAASEIASAVQAVGDVVEIDGKYGGLYKMDFMKKAKIRQQDRAREEATDILRDLENMEAEANKDDIDDDDRGKRKDVKRARSAEDMEKLEAAREEMKSKMGGVNSLLLSKTKEVNDTVDISDSQNPWLSAPQSNGRSTEKMSGKNTKKLKTDTSGGVLLDTSAWDESQELPSAKKDNTHTKKSSKKDKSKPQGDKKITIVDSTDVSSTAEEPTVKKQLKSSVSKPQATLVSEAFAGPDYENEFSALKEKMVDEELNIVGKKRQIESADKAGWGDWAGPGKIGVSERVVKKRKHLLKNLEEKTALQRAGRSDGQLANVVLSERRVKTSSKYKIADIPHPFKSREEYERSLQMPLGDEWNAAHIVKKNIKPEILTRAGRIIDPIALPKNHNKNAANASTAQRIPSLGNKTAKSKSMHRNAKFF